MQYHHRDGPAPSHLAADSRKPHLRVDFDRRLKLRFGTLIRAAKRWRSIGSPGSSGARCSLDEAQEAETGIKPKPSNDAPQTEMSSSSRT